MTVQLDTLLIRSPEICGGRLRIAGTRITVLQLATLYRQGMTAEEIAEQYPHLTLAQVYTALAYYHANQTEIVAELAAEAEEMARLEEALDDFEDLQLLRAAKREEGDAPTVTLAEVEKELD